MSLPQGFQDALAAEEQPSISWRKIGESQIYPNSLRRLCQI
jgi:hypothetical protein